VKREMFILQVVPQKQSKHKKKKAATITKSINKHHDSEVEDGFVWVEAVPL
jgi:hypothetical protein